MASLASQTDVVELDVQYIIPVAEAAPSMPLEVSNSVQSSTQVDATPPLEPADRGAAAWRLICVAYVFEALLWGEVKRAVMLAHCLN